MKIIRREEGEVVVLVLEGELMIGESANALQHDLFPLAERQGMRLLINLSGLSRIDSSGIGVIIAAFSAVSKHSSRLRLCCPGAHIRRLFERLKLHLLIAIDPDEQTALRNIRQE